MARPGTSAKISESFSAPRPWIPSRPSYASPSKTSPMRRSLEQGRKSSSESGRLLPFNGTCSETGALRSYPKNRRRTDRSAMPWIRIRWSFWKSAISEQWALEGRLDQTAFLSGRSGPTSSTSCATSEHLETPSTVVEPTDSGRLRCIGPALAAQSSSTLFLTAVIRTTAGSSAVMLVDHSRVRKMACFAGSPDDTGGEHEIRKMALPIR